MGGLNWDYLVFNNFEKCDNKITINGNEIFVNKSSLIVDKDGMRMIISSCDFQINFTNFHCWPGGHLGFDSLYFMVYDIASHINFCGIGTYGFGCKPCGEDENKFYGVRPWQIDKLVEFVIAEDIPIIDFEVRKLLEYK